MPEPALDCRALSYRYPEARADALSGVSVTIEPGEFVVLCGGSGTGKSTLLRAACGLVPHFHGGEVDGELSVAGMDIRSHGPADLAAVVGLVAQEPESQVVSTTVAAELELPLELRGHQRAERARAVEEVAVALGLDGLLERTTDSLSGGELQRVALAAALATRPSLVLLDEPTSQLDPVAGDELVSLLRRLNEDWGVTVVIGEHRLERCLAAADRVLALDDGTVAYDGAPREFLEWALEASPQLATPAARMLAAAGLPVTGSVREARAAVSGRELPTVKQAAPPRAAGGPAALSARSLWVELGSGRQRTEALRGLDLEVAGGERVALMGRNGAGKSTLFRAAMGLVEPSRGRVVASDEAALLPQRPDDLLVRERVGDELRGEEGRRALALLGLEGLEDADPRDLSGGQRQRLALALVIAGRLGSSGQPPGLLMLDEPTRGMDRKRKRDLARLIGGLAEADAAVVVATHDVEFAAEFAERVVLLGRGEVVADGAVEEILSGGWHFSTEVARVLDGRAVRAEDGISLLTASRGAAVEGHP